MRAVLIFNPTSGISTVTEKRMSPEETEQTILDGLRAYGIEPEVFHTTPEDTGQGLAQQAVKQQAELVIAAGGDGTIHAVASGLVGSSSILGIIPTGTMNNLAHSLNIPDTIPAACTTIANGQTRIIDVGQINDRVFLEVAGIGLEAALFPAAEEIKSPGILSTIRGSLEGLITLLRFKPPQLSIQFDRQERKPYKALQVTISNAPFYGMHMHPATDILMDDGLLDVIVYTNFSKFEYLRHAVSISQGRRPFQPKVKRVRVRSLRVNSSEPVEIQADGKVIGNTPATIKVIPRALRIRVSGKPAPGLHDRSTNAITVQSSGREQS
jgi:diacylglycerol kinase (ATP)